MVKKLFKFVYMLTFLMIIMGSSSAQNDFTVKSPSTDGNKNLLKPIQAGKSTTFQVWVTNNLSVYTLVSINTDVMGTVSSWATVDISNDTIRPGKSKVFNVTIAVPEGIATRDYNFLLALDAVDQNGTSRDYNYRTLTLMVDNTPPSAPDFVVSSTSKSVTVGSWESWDANSSVYDDNYGGIQRYKIMLRTPDGSIIGSNIIEASGNTSQTFTGLASNTNYKASVIAVDLAGNANTSEKAALTAPAAPTISSSAQSFCNVTLNWTASSGASSYKLYNATSTPVLVATTSNTSFVMSGLTSGATYKFFVKAYNDTDLGSDAGNTLSVSTLTVPIPIISGTTSVCSSGSTFSVTNLPSGCSLDWNQGAGLSLYSTSGNSAIFKASGNTTSWIKTTINSGCGTKSTTKTVDAGTPKPGAIFIEFDAPPRRFTASINGMASATSYKWYLNGVLKYNTLADVVIFQRQVGKCGYRYDVDVAMVNTCGVSPISHTEVYEPDCYKSYTVYPNPASSEISITQNSAMKRLSLTTAPSGPKIIKSVKIIDNTGFIYVNKRYEKEIGEVSLNVSGLKVGTYQIIINEGEDKESLTLIKGE